MSKTTRILAGIALGALLGFTVQAQTAEFMYPTNGSSAVRYDFNNAIGTFFTVGPNPAIVTHLGYFDLHGDGLVDDHSVGIFVGTTATLLAEAVVPAGTGAFYTNGFRWVQLATPVTLQANSSYTIAGTGSANDGWLEGYYPSSWNANFSVSRAARYADAAGWPQVPTSSPGPWSANAAYGTANLAMFPISLTFSAQPSPAAGYVTENATFTALAAGGSPPLNYQWYKSPSTLLTGATNSSLILTNLGSGDAGDYYVKVTDALSSVATSSNATLTVNSWAVPTFVVQPPTSQSAYIYQQVTFSSVATGSPPASISYQWQSGTTNIPGATNSSFTLYNVSLADAGNYTVIASNGVGSPATATVALTVLTPVPGTYEAAVIDTKPLVYHRFCDVATTNYVFNFGTEGTAADGLLEGTYAIPGYNDGPLPPTYPNFEATNAAPFFDQSTADEIIPAVNVGTNNGNRMTMTAWINLNGAQVPWSGVVYNRDWTYGGSGLFMKKDSSNSYDVLGYTWGDQRWNINNDTLVLPYNQWVFVALVVEPTQATLYLQNGATMITQVDTFAEVNVPFDGATTVGWDPMGGISNRRFSGWIDEVTIHNRSLSPSEIYSLYAASANFPASIMTSPQNVTNYSGLPLNLSVTAQGTPPMSYQWYNQSTGAVAGATNSIYSVNVSALGESGNYFVIVTNLFGSATSEVASVSIIAQQPILTTLPQPSSSWLGLDASFSAASYGSEPITYQWVKVGTGDLAGQTNTVLTLQNLTGSDAGSYYVRVTNPAGFTNSPAVALTVADPNTQVQMLYSTNGYTGFHTPYAPNIGNTFQMGSVNRVITHLGYFDLDGDGLIASHYVGIFIPGNPSGTGVFLAGVLVPAGTNAFFSNGYRWVALNSPLTLTNGQSYVIAASNNDSDQWPEPFVPEWNPVFVGYTPTTNRFIMYSTATSIWPQEPTVSASGLAWTDNNTYGAYNMAYFPSAVPTNVTVTAAFSGGNLHLTWPQGTLQAASVVTGPYTNVVDAVSPFAVVPTGAPQMFYRVQVSP